MCAGAIWLMGGPIAHPVLVFPYSISFIALKRGYTSVQSSHTLPVGNIQRSVS